MRFPRTSLRLLLGEMLWLKLCELFLNTTDFVADILNRYNNLFEWIVSRVNVSMKPIAAAEHVIGVLDI